LYGAAHAVLQAFVEVRLYRRTHVERAQSTPAHLDAGEMHRHHEKLMFMTHAISPVVSSATVPAIDTPALFTSRSTRGHRGRERRRWRARSAALDSRTEEDVRVVSSGNEPWAVS
jgi:hypothetical protein